MVRTLIAVTVLALAAGGGTAGAAASCAERLVNDWAADTQVDGAYARACYRRAIESLPEDLRVYSSASADLERALQARLASTPAGTPVADTRERDAADGLVRVLILVAGVSVVAVIAAAVR